MSDSAGAVITPQKSIVVFLHMASSLLRLGMLQSLADVPGLESHTHGLREYRQLCEQRNAAVDLLIIDAFVAREFLLRTEHMAHGRPRRVLLVAIGQAPLRFLADQALEFCAWLDLDQPDAQIQTTLGRVIDCVKQDSAQCTGCVPKQHSDQLSQLLSPKERAIFGQIGEGHGPDEIATQLGLSTKTIETHRARIKNKLGIRNRQDLVVVARAWRLGLFEKTMHLIQLLEQSSTRSSSEASRARRGGLR